MSDQEKATVEEQLAEMEMKLRIADDIRELETIIGLPTRTEVIRRQTVGAMRAIGENRLKMVTYLSSLAIWGVGGARILVDLGYHPNVVFGKCEKAARRGYTEYGTSAMTSWLTPKGCDTLRLWRPELKDWLDTHEPGGPTVRPGRRDRAEAVRLRELIADLDCVHPGILNGRCVEVDRDNVSGDWCATCRLKAAI